MSVSSMGFSADQHWSRISQPRWTGQSCSVISSLEWGTTKQHGPLREIEIKIELTADKQSGWSEPSGIFVIQLCASPAPTPAPTLNPSSAPPSPAPTFSSLEPLCKNTWCTFDPKDTYANTKSVFYFYAVWFVLKFQSPQNI